MSCRYKCYTLQELVNIKYGKNQKKVQDNEKGKYPIYGTGGLMGYANEFLYNKPSVLIGRKGSISKVKYVEHPFWTVDTLFYTEVNEEVVIPKYLYYKMSIIDLSNYNEGTTIPSLRTDTLNRIEFQIPSIEEQKTIVSILDSLDKKIELNNEMNKTLEEMAQTLFKRWFVDFEFPNEDGEPYKSSGGEMVESELGIIPKNWDVKMLKDISIVTMGVSPSSSSYNDKRIGLPLLNGAADFQGKLIKPSKYTTEPKKICDIGDLVFGVRATIGNTVFTDGEYALGRGVAAVKPNNDCYRELIYLILNNSMEKLINNASGSVFLNLKKADITDLKVCFNSDIVYRFHRIVNKLINKIIENDKESEILKQSRDSLLPKLMNGEIRVDDIEANL